MTSILKLAKPVGFALLLALSAALPAVDAQGAQCADITWPAVIGAADTAALTAAITCANANPDHNEITLTESEYLFETGDVTDPDSALPVITTPITIHGSGATLKRALSGPDFRLIHVKQFGDLTLNDVTVTGGETFTNGGGVYVERGMLTVTDSTFSGNTSGFSGGGIYNFIGTVTIVDSVLSGNDAYEGGGVADHLGVLTISNSALVDNTANSVGGGFYGFSNDPTTITDSVVSGNESSGAGGGIYHSGHLTLTNSEVTGNTAPNQGGGIYNNGDSAQLTLIESTVSGNTAASGGGIYSIGYTTVSLTDSEISGNSADDGDGGGLYNNGGTLTVTTSTISGNGAGDSGGAIFGTTLSTKGAITVTDSEISGSSATAGGGIYNDDGTLTVTNSTISGNSASLAGGGLYHNRGAATVVNSIVSGNDTGSEGGGLYNADGTLSVTNSTVSGNSAVDIGGGIYNTGTLIVTSSILWGNTSSIRGNGAVTVSYSIVEAGFGGTGNLAVDPQFVAPQPHTSAPTTAGDYHIQVTSPATDMGDSSVVPPDTYDIDGDPRIIGPAVDIGADERIGCASYLAPSSVPAGDTAAFVSAIVCANADPDVSTIILTGSLYSFTSASGPAAALPSITTPVVIEGNGAMIERDAGAVTNFGLLHVAQTGTLTLDDASLSGSTGSGIHSLGTTTVLNSTIEGHDQYGIFNCGVAAGCALTVANSTIRGNETGIFIENHGSAVVTNSLIAGNDIDGIFNANTSTVTVTNSTIAGNGSTGLFNIGSVGYGAAVVANSILWGNAATQIDLNNSTSISDSIVQGGFTGTNVIDADPLFVAPQPHTSAPTTAGDYRLQANSPALNVGGSAAVPPDTFDLDGDSDTAEPAPDLDGAPRIVNATVDLGAYEHQTPAGVTVVGTNAAVAEGGATDSYTVVLMSRPAADVTITVATGGQTTVDPTTLTFTPDDWLTAQTVTITAVDDPDVEGAHTDIVSHTAASADTAYDGMSVTGIAVDIADDELPPAELLLNGGFEVSDGARLPASWIVRNQQFARQICGSGKANSGECAFKFKRGGDKRTTLIQAVDLSGLSFSAGDTLSLSAYMRDQKLHGPVDAVLVARYADAPADKVKLRMSHNGSYALFTLDLLTLTSGAVTDIRVKVKHKPADGAAVLDDASLIWTPIASRGHRQTDILPPPAAPDGFRGSN